MRVHVIWAEGLSICHWRGETIDYKIQIPLYQVLPSFITSTHGWRTCCLAGKGQRSGDTMERETRGDENRCTERFRGVHVLRCVCVCVFALSLRNVCALPSAQ